MSRLDKAYARCFKNRPQGHALYSMVSAKRLKPGTCGYFDRQGDWQEIVQTSDAAALIDHNLGALQKVKIFTDEGAESWRGPLLSEGVKRYRTDATIRGSDGTDTVVVGAHLAFSSSVDCSAILVTDGEVEHNQAGPAAKYREWMEQNMQAVVDLSADAETIKKKGIWIVTKTYTAKQCAIGLMQAKNSEISFGVEAGADGVKLAPSVEWWEGQKDSDWRVLQNPDGVVMFMSGIWWKSSFLSSQMKAKLDKKKQKFLAGEPGPVATIVEISIPGSAGKEYFQATPFAVGKDTKEFGNLKAAKGTPYDEDGDEDSDASDEQEGGPAQDIDSECSDEDEIMS